MFVPEGLTETEVISAIDKISTNLSKRFAFACYTQEDLKQQCFVWALENLHKFEPGRPLQNFLQVVLKNKLRNLKRDKLKRQKSACEKCDSSDYYNHNSFCEKCNRWLINNTSKSNIMYPINIESINEEQEESLQINGEFNRIEFEEVSNEIADKLSPKLRADYLRMIDGASVSSERRRVIKNEIKRILGDEQKNWEA